jgi:hypothetical protein
MPAEVPFKIYFHTDAGSANETLLASVLTPESAGPIRTPLAYVSKEDFVYAVVRAAGIWSDSGSGRTFKYMGTVNTTVNQDQMQALVIPEVVNLVTDTAACNALDHSIIDIYDGPYTGGAHAAAVTLGGCDPAFSGTNVNKRFFIRFFTKIPTGSSVGWFPGSVVSASQDIVSAAVHEFGHALGLLHLDVSGDPRAGAMGTSGLGNSSARGRDFTQEDFACMDEKFTNRQSFARIIRRSTGNWPNSPAADWLMIQPHGNFLYAGQSIPPKLFDDAAAGRDFSWSAGGAPSFGPVLATTGINFLDTDPADPRHQRVRQGALTPSASFLNYDAEVGTNSAPRVGPTVGFWIDQTPTTHRVFFSEATDTHITEVDACTRQYPAFPATVEGNGGCERHRVMVANSNNGYASETILPVQSLTGSFGPLGVGQASTQIFSNKPVALASWQADLTAVAARFAYGVSLTAWVHSGYDDSEASQDGDKDVYLSVGAYDNNRLHKPINLGAFGVRSEVGPGLACHAPTNRCVLAYVDSKDSKALVRVFNFRVVTSSTAHNTNFWAQPFTIVSLGTQVMNSTEWSGNRLAVMFEDRTGTVNDMWWLALRSLRAGQPTEMYRKTATGASWSYAGSLPWASKTGPATSHLASESQPFFAITQ